MFALPPAAPYNPSGPVFPSPLPFLAPAITRGPASRRPKLSLTITPLDTPSRYSPAKIAPCEFLSPATKRNTLYNRSLDSDEESGASSSESENDEEVRVVRSTKKQRREVGRVRFVEEPMVRVFQDEEEWVAPATSIEGTFVW